MNGSVNPWSHKAEMDRKREEEGKRVARLMNTLGFLMLVWGLVFPVPYDLVVWVMVLAPFFSLLLIHHYKGVVTLDSDRLGKKPYMLMAFMAPIPVLVLRALFDYEILIWSHFWLPFILFTLVLLVMVFRLAEDIRVRISNILMMLFFCAFFGFGATLSMNAALDTSMPHHYRAQIMQKRISRGKTTSYYLKLSSWGPRAKAKDVSVPKYTYDKKAIGDSADIMVHPGRFGIPWFKVR